MRDWIKDIKPQATDLYDALGVSNKRLKVMEKKIIKMIEDNDSFSSLIASIWNSEFSDAEVAITLFKLGKKAASKPNVQVRTVENAEDLDRVIKEMQELQEGLK